MKKGEEECAILMKSRTPVDTLLNTVLAMKRDKGHQSNESMDQQGFLFNKFIEEFKGINNEYLFTQLGLVILIELTIPNLHRPYCQIEIYYIFVCHKHTHKCTVICY